MKILVTGGGGFLGQAGVRDLLDRGLDVVTLNRSRYPTLETWGVDARRGDVADPGAVMDAAASCDAVIHVAAKAGPGLVRREFERSHMMGTRNVLDARARHRIRYPVLTSSPSVVHDGGDIENGNESLPYPCRFPAPYPATKAVAERMVLAASGSDLRTCALRPHLIWGPGDNHLLMALDNVVGGASAEGKAHFISNGEPVLNGIMIARLLEAAGEVPRLRTVSPGVAKVAAAAVEGLWRLSRSREDPPVSRFVVGHLATAHWYDLGAARRDLGYVIEEGLERLAVHFGAGRSPRPSPPESFS